MRKEKRQRQECKQLQNNLRKTSSDHAYTTVAVKDTKRHPTEKR